MRSTPAVVAAALALVTVAPVAMGQFGPSRSEVGPQVLFFEAFPLREAGDSLHERIDIHYRVDKEFFVPVRDPDGHSPFHRTGEIIAELADSTGQITARAMHSIEIPGEDADRKPLGNDWKQGILSLLVAPGRYRIQMTVEDEESRRSTMDSSRFLRTPPRTASGLATAFAVPVATPEKAKGMPPEVTLMNYGGDILFGRPASLLVAWTSGTGRDTLLRVKYSFAEDPPAPEDSPFLPADGEVTVPVYHGLRFVPFTDTSRAGYKITPDGDGRTCAAVVPVPFARLLLRSYRMTFSFSSGADRTETARKGRAVWPDMPFTLKDIDNALDALRYIAPESIVDSLRSGSMEKRRANLEGFWRSRGGKQESAFNDVMTEYYRRADYATRNFGTLHVPDGFRSDRGKIYVLYGPPTSTDRALDPVSGFQEVWIYGRLRKKFTFIDHNKSGNYVLVSATAL